MKSHIPSDNIHSTSVCVGNLSTPTFFRWLYGRLHAPLYIIGLEVLLVLLAFSSCIDLERLNRAKTEGFSTQSAIKILIVLMAGILGGWGWWRSPDVRKLLVAFPGILFVILGVLYFVSFPFSLLPTISLASAIAYVCILLFCASCIVYLGGNRTIACVAIGSVAFLVGSILLYFVRPESAILIEVMSATNKVPRFGGLGHPNTLGRLAIFTALVSVGFVVSKKLHWKWLLVLVPFLIGTALSTLSRSPVIAGIAASSVLLLPYARQKKYVGLFVTFAIPLTILLVLAFTLTDPSQLTGKIVRKLTKTGEVEEVTTMTGRTEIWKFAIEQSYLSPFVGHGAGSTPILMIEKSGHAHNILLQPIVCLGFPAGLIVLSILVWNGFTVFNSKFPIGQLFLGYLLVLGIAESPLFGPLPDNFTIAWIVCSLWSGGDPIPSLPSRSPIEHA